MENLFLVNFFSQSTKNTPKRPATARRFFLSKSPVLIIAWHKLGGYCHVFATRLAQTFPQKSSIYRGSREVCATFATFATTSYNIYI